MGLWSKLLGSRKKPARAAAPEPHGAPRERVAPEPELAPIEAAELQSQVCTTLARFARDAQGAARTLAQALGQRVSERDLAVPPMPQAVLKARRLLDEPDCRMEDIAAELQTDPALVTRLIGVANSPFYAGLDPVPSVLDAVVRIGLRETRQVLLAIAMRARVFRIPGGQERAEELWQHALATSHCAQALAAEVALDPESAALAGLVHDVGRVAIEVAASQLHRDSRGRTSADLSAIGEVGAALHEPLGALIVKSWAFPDAIAHAVAHHHDPTPESPRLAAVLRAADTAAHMLCERISEDECWEAIVLPPGLELEDAKTAVAEAADAYAIAAKAL